MRTVLVLTAVVGAISLGVLVGLAWDPEDAKPDPAAMQVVRELRYQNCILRALAVGVPNPRTSQESIEQLDASTVANQAVVCKRP